MSDGSERELLGMVWDTWGALTPRQKKRITRRHPRLAATLEMIQTHVWKDRGGIFTELHQRIDSHRTASRSES